MSLNPRNVALDLAVERIAKRVTRKIMYASMILASNAASVAQLIDTYGLDENKNDLDVDLVAVCYDIKKAFQELSNAIGHAELRDQPWYKFWKQNKVEDKIMSYILSDDFDKVLKRLSIYTGMGDKLTEYNEKVNKSVKVIEKYNNKGGKLDEESFKEFAKIVGAGDKATSISKEQVVKYLNDDGKILAILSRLEKAYGKVEKLFDQADGFIDRIVKRCTMNSISNSVLKNNGEVIDGLKRNKTIVSLFDSINEDFVALKKVVDDIKQNMIVDLKTEASELNKKLQDAINQVKDEYIKQSAGGGAGAAGGAGAGGSSSGS